jgi:hypothetical protein
MAVSRRCCMRAAFWNDGTNSKTVQWKRPCSLGAKRTAFSPSQFEWLASPATSRRWAETTSFDLAVDGHVPEELAGRFYASARTRWDTRPTALSLVHISFRGICCKVLLEATQIGDDNASSTSATPWIATNDQWIVQVVVVTTYVEK